MVKIFYNLVYQDLKIEVGESGFSVVKEANLGFLPPIGTALLISLEVAHANIERYGVKDSYDSHFFEVVGYLGLVASEEHQTSEFGFRVILEPQEPDGEKISSKVGRHGWEHFYKLLKATGWVDWDDADDRGPILKHTV